MKKISQFAQSLTKQVTVLLFAASIAGVVISFLLLKEDIMSTANTLTIYFPMQFNVTPSSEENGWILGLFISVIQIVSAGVMMSEYFSKLTRWMSAIMLLIALPFDAWTDIVYRSGYLAGNIPVAVATTIAFYTFGSEIMQSLSLMVFFTLWRQALADIFWGVSYAVEQIKTIAPEVASFRQAANRLAIRESERRVSNRAAQPLGYTPTASGGHPQQYQQQYRPATPQSSFKPATTQPSSNYPRPAPKPLPTYDTKPEPTYHPVSTMTSANPTPIAGVQRGTAGITSARNVMYGDDADD